MNRYFKEDTVSKKIIQKHFTHTFADTSHTSLIDHVSADSTAQLKPAGIVLQLPACLDSLGFNHTRTTEQLSAISQQ